MHDMSVAGFRGAVDWKPSVTGLGGKLSYDTWRVRFGFFVVFALGKSVHIWDIPSTKFGGSCKAILLRRDPEFKRRVLREEWMGWSLMALGLVLFLVGILFLVRMYFILSRIAFAGFVGVVAFWFLRKSDFYGDPRDSDLRRLLGPHEWGTSDPATWSKSLVAEVVDPEEAFNVESFAALAKTLKSDKNWGEAMWAARLCVAVEDEAVGEKLTDSILNNEEVIEGLEQVRKKPATRDKVFGQAPGLQMWVRCDPDDHIFEIH
jgi:hypothetical protein